MVLQLRSYVLDGQWFRTGPLSFPAAMAYGVVSNMPLKASVVVDRRVTDLAFRDVWGVWLVMRFSVSDRSLVAYTVRETTFCLAISCLRKNS